MPSVLSVNIGSRVRFEQAEVGHTGIGKRPVTTPVEVRAPGPRGVGGSGLVGDHISDLRHHGGDDQAVYAYAREDLDDWAVELGRDVPPGLFGENLTTAGLDVSGALVGERWRVGSALLQVTSPRVPCRTFAAVMERGGWVKAFTRRAVPGAYLRVLEPGVITAGDPVEVVHRPDHDVTIARAFRALLTEPELLPGLLAAGDDLPADARRRVERRLAAPASDPA
ncbi:MOSC domain-containing protein [Saccharothrix syringae]|uniref:MOSC domain-containing protein n=1 Tax=Saccharothrix syringae TaxID=103733 RepID=A0A5Q0H8M4_SACSY|nr:MOSC domain-containing protein [Saccharothrix syringae]QFZ22190.1 MOSC domain-containing protein [Saccharothrix syringae]